jgi:predicted DNA-binding transcriptional regulator YafY
MERLMAIVLKIYKVKKITAQELANTFEVNVRTIYRDIEALSEMNIPIIAHTGNEGGYSLMEEYFIPPIIFNKDEAFTLLLSQKLMDIINIPGYSQYINTVFLKIKNSMDESQEKDIANISKKVLFNIQCKNPPVENFNFFGLIKKCLEEDLKIKIQYFNPHRIEITERIIQPYGIIFEDGVWYIIALCELRNEKRWFRIDRIRDAELIEEKFEFPSSFNIEHYLNDHNYIKAEQSSDSCQIKFRVTKEMYFIVKDYFYFKYGQAVEEKDCYIVSVKTINPENYIHTAFQFFDGVEILEPLWLREKFKDEVEKLCKKYTT